MTPRHRAALMQLLRVALAFIVSASVLFAPRIVGTPYSHIAAATAVYLALAAVAEASRRVRRAQFAVVAAMLLGDGVYLAWVIYETGGASSPLQYLVYLHLIAASLVLSYRTGLKVALWHSLLFFVFYYAQLAGLVIPLRLGPQPFSPDQPQRPSIFTVVAFLLVAMVTAACSALNERELRRRTLVLEVLTEMAAKLDDVTHPSAIADVLLLSVLKAFGFRSGVVLRAPDGSVMASQGSSAVPPMAHPMEADELVRQVCEKPRTLLLAKLEPNENPGLASMLPFARNLIIVPMVAEGGGMAILVVEDGRRGSHIRKGVITMVAQFASHAALALRNAWLLHQLQHRADTDPLTGIANRRTFDKAIEREVSRATRNGEQVALAMIDIDHFKSLNDTYGHQEGDQVLQRVGQALTTHCRDFDIVARYGGEEFAIILPTYGSPKSIEVAERLRQVISQTEATVPITASVGVATFPKDSSDATSLVAAADRALYRSKRGGRNRVSAAGFGPKAHLAQTGLSAASASREVEGRDEKRTRRKKKLKSPCGPADALSDHK